MNSIYYSIADIARLLSSPERKYTRQYIHAILKRAGVPIHAGNRNRAYTVLRSDLDDKLQEISATFDATQTKKSKKDKRMGFTVPDLTRTLSAINPNKPISQQYLTRLLIDAGIKIYNVSKGAQPFVFRVSIEKQLSKFAKILDQIEQESKSPKEPK